MVTGLLPVRLTGGLVRRRGKTLLGPIDVEIAGHGLSVVLGPNGAGKTTLLKSLHGIERLSEGTLSYGVPGAEARARQAFVFQTPIMLRRSLRRNLAYPLHLAGWNRARIDAETGAWADRIGLSHRLDVQATRLSGGERQRLALARALIAAPELLFLDEPCANLDGRATREIEAMLIAARDAGTRIVMSTHDMGQARRLATEALFLLHGRLHEAGRADSFFQAPRTAEARAFLKGDIVE